MHKLFASVACALLVAAAAPAVRAASPTPPQLRLPATARPLAVAAELAIDPAKESFDGRIEIDLELLEPTSLLWLNASRLEIDSAVLQVGAETIAATAVPGGEQFVGLQIEREVGAGRAKAVIAYRGRLDAIETEGLFRQKSGEDWYVFSQFESIFARRAFPSFDEPSYRTPWKLTLRVPAGVEAVANMPVVAERRGEDGTKVVEFAPTPPIPSYLVAFGVGPFDFVDAGRWGRGATAVRVIVPKGKAAQAAFAAEATGPLLAVLEEYFEIPYAFGKLDYLVVPHTVGFGAMENPGLITYVESGALMPPAAATLERKRRFADTVAHENAHQWFGDYVTMAWWDDIWLNEGFATWMESKAVTSWRPEWYNEGDRYGWRGWAAAADSRASAKSVRRPIANTDDIETAFDGISYAKGGALLQMFESWMGEARFRTAIRHYLREHALGNATSDDFLAALATQSPEVADAFASFLDQPGVPVVTFAASCLEGQAPRLELTQRRYSPLGLALGEGQLWHVPVVARYGSGEQIGELKTVLSMATGSVELPFCPQWVSGNGGGVGYYVSEYRGELFAALVAGVEALPIGEQMGLLSDAAMLLGAGTLSPAETLGLLPSFAGSPHRQVVEAVIRIAASVSDHLVADELRSNYQRFLQRLLGERARQAGLAPHPEESDEEGLLRADLVALIADEGRDEQLVAEAGKLARAWLADRDEIHPTMLPTTLVIAAQNGDAALFDGLLARLEATSDRRERGALFGALGSFRDPALVQRSLGLLLDGKFDLREAYGIVRHMSTDRHTRQATFDWIRVHYEAFAALVPEPWRAGLAMTGRGFCDEAGRRATAELFAPRLANVAQGPIRLEQTLEEIDRCIARRQAQLPQVSELLAAY